MDYCGPRALPHSEFLTWREDDQEKALWWLSRDRQRCSGCGTHPDDWNPDVGGDRDAYAATELVCPGCQRRAVAEEQLAKDRREGHAKHGIHVVLTRTPRDAPPGG